MSTADVPTARDIDVRGFIDALAPVRQRQQWRVDRAMLALARAQKLLLDTEASLVEAEGAHASQAGLAAQALAERMDPSAHRRTLLYLAQLKTQCERLKSERQERQADCDRLRRESTAEQLRLEGLSRHRADALDAYADDVRKRTSVEQDREWLSRSFSSATARSTAP